MSDDLREFRQCPRCGYEYQYYHREQCTFCGYRVRTLDNIEPIPARLQAAVIGMFLFPSEIQHHRTGATRGPWE